MNHAAAHKREKQTLGIAAFDDRVADYESRLVLSSRSREVWRGVRSGFRFRKRLSVSVQSQRGPLDDGVDALRCEFPEATHQKPDLTPWRILLDGETDCEPFLPWKWASEHPDSIRQYRVRERNDRAERKRAKR